MDRFLAKLERRFGAFAIQHLTGFIVGGMAIAFMLIRLRPEMRGAMMLDLDAVAHGQVWRLVTYLFLPRSSSIIWIIVSLSWVWMIGSNLESEWGAFKFNIFYLVGMLGMTAAAWISGAAVGNTWLNMSLLFAFATLYPDFPINPFLIVPVSIPVKWIALIALAYVLYEAVDGDWYDRAAIIASLANYLLFFSGTLVGVARSGTVQARQAARRGAMREASEERVTGGRTCAMCGKAEDDGADIRVCSCEKCKPSRTLCLEHARNH